MTTICKIVELIDQLEGKMGKLFLLTVGSFTLILIFIQVLFRYVFYASTGWYSDIVSFAYFWSIFIGIYYAFRLGRHVYFDSIVDLIKSERARIIVEIIATSISLFFSICLIYYGIQIVTIRYSMGISSPYFEIPMYVEGLIVPLAGLLIFCATMWQILKQIVAISQLSTYRKKQ